MKTEVELNLKSEWPTAVGRVLEPMLQELQRVLGHRCSSVILYGGLAKGKFTPERFDINLVVVVDQVTVELLDQLAKGG